MDQSGKLFPDRYLHSIPACWFHLCLLLSVALVFQGIWCVVWKENLKKKKISINFFLPIFLQQKCKNSSCTHWLLRDNERDREQQMLLKSINSHRE